MKRLAPVLAYLKPHAHAAAAAAAACRQWGNI
jgi:hypothetical protein